MALCSHVVNCSRGHFNTRLLTAILQNTVCSIPTGWRAARSRSFMQQHQGNRFHSSNYNLLGYKCTSCKHEGFSDRNPKWPLQLKTLSAMLQIVCFSDRNQKWT